MLKQGGGVKAARIPRLALLFLRLGLARLGLWREEHLRTRGTLIRGTDRGRSTRTAPVFIVGHYRSGTTLVHKLMAADPRFASVTTFDLLFPTCPPALAALIQPGLQAIADLVQARQPFFHDYRVRLDDPNELEPLMLALGSEWSSYWGYFFPRQADFFLNRFVLFPTEEVRCRWKEAYSSHVERVARRCPGRALVIKDPPNTGRVDLLLDLFPGARFINVVRDPVDVFLSMRSLWRNTILPRYALHDISVEACDGIVLRHYRNLMECWRRTRFLIPEGSLAEVRYENLTSAPLRCIQSLYHLLGLPSFQAAEPSITRRWLEDRRYEPSAERPSPELLRWARTKLEEWITWLGYG